MRHDVQTHDLDNDAFHQRVTRFLAEHQRRKANNRTDLEQKVVRLRRDFQEAVTETATSFTRIQQEFQGSGARREQLSQFVYNGLMRQMEDFKTRLDHDEARVTQVGQEGDRFSHDTCNSIRLCVEEEGYERND